MSLPQSLFTAISIITTFLQLLFHSKVSDYFILICSPTISQPYFHSYILTWTFHSYSFTANFSQVYLHRHCSFTPYISQLLFPVVFFHSNHFTATCFFHNHSSRLLFHTYSFHTYIFSQLSIFPYIHFPSYPFSRPHFHSYFFSQLLFSQLLFHSHQSISCLTFTAISSPRSLFTPVIFHSCISLSQSSFTAVNITAVPSFMIALSSHNLTAQWYI